MIGYYESNKICEPCSYKCLECTSKNTCTVCADVRTGETCECPASSGVWDNGVDAEC